MSSSALLSLTLEGWREFVGSLSRLNVDERTRAFLDAAGQLVRDQARIRAPVNSGLLRAQIFHETDTANPPRFVDIGANVHYAPYMEYGTGLVHDHPNWPKERHVPFVNRDERGNPVPGLVYWAKRKGLNAYAVAHAIAKRGGLKPRRFIRDSLDTNAREIGERWREVWEGLARDAGNGGRP